jgi:uncharacterized membrane protein
VLSGLEWTRMIHVHEWIELAAQGVEALAVALMVTSILVATLGWFIRSLKTPEGAYERYRIVLGKTLLVGLGLLVAADIINTVAFALTLTNLALLAGLVVVRTALGWTLTVELEGRWPWQKMNESQVSVVDQAPQPASLKPREGESGMLQKGPHEYARFSEQIL